MKKAIIVGERRAELVDVPDPKPKNDWAVVKVHVAPMCTEYKMFVSGQKADNLGHEAVGEVVEVAQPGRVKPGDRVVVQPLYGCGKCPLCISGEYIHCEQPGDFALLTGGTEGRATMTQYLVKPDWLLPAIPNGMSYERAGLALCALGPSFGAFQRLGLTAFDTVLVTGLGPVGLGGVTNARFRGARVLAVDSNAYRIERARQLEAEHVLDPRDPEIVSRIRDLTGGRGVDCALDCSGNVQAERLLIDATRRKGKIAFVGECQADLAVRVSPDLIRKGLTIIGSWHYNLNDYPALMKVIQQSPLVEQLVSHVFPMSRIQQALETSATNQTAKMLLRPWE
ncbi:MAG: zinc-binding dehydrogenase [Planctomycetes bacterium]|nr:zinc-binding dehydrogenase [Planctomycetota bacterium]